VIPADEPSRGGAGVVIGVGEDAILRPRKSKALRQNHVSIEHEREGFSEPTAILANGRLMSQPDTPV